MWKKFIKGLVLSFVSRLSLWYWLRRFDCTLQVVSIYWVELFVQPWLLVIGVSQTSLMVGGFRAKALLALWEEETDPPAVRRGRGKWGRLSCFFFCRHPRFRNLNSTVPVDVVRVKSHVDSLFNSTRLPVRVSVNKLNFVPESGYTEDLFVRGSFEIPLYTDIFNTF